MPVTEKRRSPRHRWLTWLGAAIGIALVGALVWRLDWRQFAEVLRATRPEFVLATFLAIVAEQLVRAWKWRQILTPLCRAGTSHLFGATMAGYLASLLVPLGVSPFVRSWLVARRQHVAMTSVLATVAVDRSIDGLVFAGIVVFVVVAAVVPDPDGTLALGLIVAAGASAAAVVAALLLLVLHRRQSASGTGVVLAIADRLPARFTARARSLAVTFADGIVWPREPWRGAGIIAASIVIKLLAASHLLWTGLAFDVLLAPLAYLALLAILGLIVVLAHVTRVPGGFIVGSVFALGLFGVEAATAAAMVAVVTAATLLAVGVFGAWGLWAHGVGLRDLGGTREAVDAAS